MSALTRHASPGCVVEFLHNNKPQLALVVEDAGGRLRLFTLGRRETTMPAARLLPWLGPLLSLPMSRAQMEQALDSHEETRRRLEAEVDPLELWELVQGEMESADLEFLAETLWSREEAREPDRRAALGRALLQCKTHFRFQPPRFEIFPRDKVDARQAEAEAQAAREALRLAGERLFPLLWKAHLGQAAPPPPPTSSTAAPEELELAALLRRRAVDPDDQDTAPLWTALRKGLPPDEPLLPLLLAQAWGVLPVHCNLPLLQAGYETDPDWAAPFAEDMAAWLDAARAARRPVEETPPLVSVDGETTRDIDDAFHVAPLPDGGFLCHVALACPALGFPLRSPLGERVLERASSLYLPEAVHHMLPESLGIGEFSLFAGQDRPVLLLTLRLDAEGALTEATPRLAWVRVAENLHYAQAEARLAESRPREAGGEDDSLDSLDSLSVGLRLARLRRRRRLERGALQVERAEPEVELEGEGAATRARFVLKPETPGAQLLVSELMILVNAAAARWAAEQGVPLLHRTQDVVISREAQGIWRRPEDIHRVMRGVGATGLEMDPKPHATLGEPLYAPVSSPLRRSVDLVNQLQCITFLQEGAPLLDRSALGALLPSIQAGAESTGRVQRFRVRYWKLLALKQAEGPFPAVVVDEGGPLVTCALPLAQLYIRGPRRLFDEDCHVGQHVLLTLGRIDPLRNEMHILETSVDYTAGEG